jgi:hypothetical protein
MNFKKLFLALLISSTFFTSCTDENDNDAPLGTYDNGVLILNQGGFGAGNASISYLSDDLVTFQNNIFSVVNPSITLGDTAQDIGFYNEFAYVVLNGSNKIEIMNRYTMTHIATISSGLVNPRYIVFNDGKGYVSNWGNGSSTSDDYIAVINLATNSVSETIDVVEGPEKMVVKNDKIYIAHLGGYGFGNTISVLNTTNDEVTSIAVGDAPNSLQISDNNLYVISGGKPSWSGSETAGKLSKINLSTNAVNSIDFDLELHPSNLQIDNSDIYYTVDSDIYKTTKSATTLPLTALFSTTDQGVYGVYSFAVDNDMIYVGDAVDYSSNGKVHIYSTAGTLIDSKTVGVIPAGFYFN